MQENGGSAKGEWRWLAGLAVGVLVFVAMAYTAREAVRKPAAKPLHTPLVPKEEAEAPPSQPAKKDAKAPSPSAK